MTAASSSSSASPPPLRNNNNNMALLPLAFLALSSILLPSRSVVESFSPPLATRTRPSRILPATSSTGMRRRRHGRAPAFFMSAGEAALPLPLEEGDDDEMEWVEEEFELLTERDFYNTEWKIGTLMDDDPRNAKSIDTTWVRLLTTEDGDNKAVWGDGSEGKWTVDVPTQFFSISKESFGGWLGKKIWAGTIEDYYYLEGTVRGWSPISPASVVGQWQGVRLGVVNGDRVGEEERGEAPWFAASEEVDEEEEDGGSEADAEKEDGDVVA
eukprot:CAMPEP_0172525866 /NCGR_PEP_ID=MMETSP1067-20121228/890_1 /TAXON_ID=265564 ORGANISM="Thalassiosira punctigera, Strain Tpunct2005C2" /NCGR_SAMPLE_ID=MMETSP1067 /ASSEMBLY_ACC=CAM_ASM_000444 /LENGTH=269 /DNA_ID=CAMNT_0013309247 /DNA_START=22 /DNA_END=831 /DNA_ORIENTATION=+